MLKKLEKVRGTTKQRFSGGSEGRTRRRCVSDTSSAAPFFVPKTAIDENF